MAFLRKVLAVLIKDVRAEIRTKDIFSAMLVFALLSVVIFQFAFDLRVDNVRQVVPGVLWVSITFAGILGLNRSFVLEKDKGSLEGLLLTPVDRGAIYLGKMLANMVFIVVVEMFIIPLSSIFFNVPLWLPSILLAVALGTVGFAAVGTVFSAMSVNTRAREVLLPILLLPVIVPVLIAGVRISGGILDGQTLGELSNWLQLLVVFDVLYLAASFLAFDFVVEE